MNLPHARLLSTVMLFCLLSACAHAPLGMRTAGKNATSRTSTPSADQRLADGALASGNQEMATTLYKKILEKNPNSLPALSGLAEALFQGNELQQARQVYLQIETLEPLQPQAEIGLARICIREHNLEQAQAHYQAILNTAPNYLPALAGLGVSYDLQGHYDQAQATYARALMSYPDDMGLRNDLGLSLILSHQVRAGISELLKIVDTPSAPPQVRQNLALGYGLLGNASAAERVLKLDMPDNQVQNNLQYYQILRSRLGSNSKTEKQP